MSNYDMRSADREFVADYPYSSRAADYRTIRTGTTPPDPYSDSGTHVYLGVSEDSRGSGARAHRHAAVHLSPARARELAQAIAAAADLAEDRVAAPVSVPIVGAEPPEPVVDEAARNSNSTSQEQPPVPNCGARQLDIPGHHGPCTRPLGHDGGHTT